MDRYTLEYACNVLDKQHSHIASAQTATQRNAQKAFYEGMKTMLEIILTAGYTNDVNLHLDKYGIHRVD